MDFLTNPNLKNVSELSTTSSKVLVVDGADNTIKWRSPGGIVSDGGVASSVGRIYILTATGAGWSEEVASSSNPGTAAPIGGQGYDRFVVGFKPTNFRISFRQMSVGDNLFGIRAQFSTSVSFSSPVNSSVVYASYDLSADVIRSGTGTISLTGSAPYYMRFLYYNGSAGSLTVAIQNLSIELWN